MFAKMSLTTDLAWPWSLPGLGLGAFCAVGVVLIGLTVWTYLGVRGSSWRRVGIVLALRLLALIVTGLLVLRPSFATEEEDALEPSRFLVLVDVSKSMDVRDELNNLSRLARAHGLLASNATQSVLARLTEDKKIEFVFYQGAVDVKRLDPAAKAEGKVTDVHRWLDDILREQAGEKNVLGLLIFSDGADTGDPLRSLRKAAEYRGKIPIHALALGQPTTTGQDKDVALEQITVEPQPILAKGKLKATVLVRSSGFENSQADFSLWLEDRATKKMIRAAVKSSRLTHPAGQEIALEADAPDQDGEIKITVKMEPLPGEVSIANNEISTFASVSKEGVRILWVEGKKRAFESVFAIRHALSKDRRFRVVYAERLKSNEATPKENDPFDFDKTAYDVLVIGDVSAERLSGGNPQVLSKIRDRVQNQGMGLVMLGGYETFANGDWPRSPLADLFPVRFDRPGQIEGKARVVPTREGLQYLLKLSDDDARNQELWSKILEPLEGMTRPGTLDPRATLLATREGDDSTPALAGITRGKGRVLIFPGDTTWQAWRRSPEALPAYERFWKQMMLWLAQQENSQGNVFVQLDQRRLDRGRTPQLGYKVGFRGIEVLDASFTAKIIGPRKEEYPLTIGADPRGQWSPPGPGEYMLVVDGKGRTSAGQPIAGKDQARFLVFEEDRETLRPAADHDFLEKLAAASDGSFARAEERTLMQRLEELKGTHVAAETRIRHWPDWRRAPTGPGIGEQVSTLWQSTALGCLLVYLSCLCLEWFLRRRWGMV